MRIRRNEIQLNYKQSYEVCKAGRIKKEGLKLKSVQGKCLGRNQCELLLLCIIGSIVWIVYG